MTKKTISLKQLPVELFNLFNKNGVVELVTRAGRLVITKMRIKSNVADINGDLYFFGNTYKQINPYKSVTNYTELVNFCNLLAHSMDILTKGKVTDICYLSATEIMHNGEIAEKLLTSKDVVYPDYTVELYDKEVFQIIIDEDRSVLSTEDNLLIEKVGSFDLKKLFKAEYLNSLYIVKMSHDRDLDIGGIMNLLPQLEQNKTIDVVTMFDSKMYVTVCLHIPENLIPEVFGYKLKKRTTKVRLENLTKLYISKSVEG